ncbi:MAG: rhamnulokinase [Candidatus Helarchaeota archaeon]
MEDADYLAFDFGASSARAIAGRLEKNKIITKEIYRFDTGGTHVLGSIYWDILHFYNEVKKALRIQAKSGNIRSCGFDSWGVDFVLLDRFGNLISNPYHYRDPRTDGILDILFKKVAPPEYIFKITGIQFIQINSLVQLYSMVVNNSPFLKISDTFLMIADFFNYLLTGRKLCEYTLASTTQLIDLETKNWSSEIISKMGLSQKMFPKIVEPGTKIDKISSSIAKDTGINEDVEIIAPASHDTASAIAAVPTEERDFIYISSGTWALMGTELEKPNISEDAFKYNFTNEGGVFNTIRFLKNITGFWLLQECKRIWEEHSGISLSYSALTREALGPEIKPFESLIFPDHHDFLNPINMPEAIQNYCRKTDQKIPKTRGEIVRCILESIAFRYREVCDMIKSIFPKKRFRKIYIIGGGAQNSVLSQFTANVNNMCVKAGPVEATALGNLLMQAYGVGDIKSLKEIRKIIKETSEIRTYQPKDISFWEEGYKKYKENTKNYR